MSYEKVIRLKMRIIIGTKQTLKAMENGEISEIFIADDADKHITQKVASLAEELEIPCHYVDSMVKLGKACGIDIGASTAAVRK